MIKVLYFRSSFSSWVITRQDCDVDTLVKHALKALSGCVTGDKELDVKGATVAIVGKVNASANPNEYGRLDGAGART